MAIFKGQLRPHIWVAAHMVTIQEFREGTRKGRNWGGGRVDELLPVPNTLWASEEAQVMSHLKETEVNLSELERAMSVYFWYLKWVISFPFSASKIYPYHKHAVLGMKFRLPEGEWAQASQGSTFHREGRTDPCHESKPLSVFQWRPRHSSDVSPSRPPFTRYDLRLAFSVSLGTSLLPKPSLRI